jgi:hypothetical protein
MNLDHEDFALYRAELQRDYSPANAQERLLVEEVAICKRRLEQARHREDLFFDLQKTSTAIRCGESTDAFKQDGGEVRMWLDQPHKAYDQVLRSIRDTGIAFDRAIRRIEQVRNRRLTRERADRKEEEKREARALRAAAPTRAKSAGQAQAQQAEMRPQENGHTRSTVLLNIHDLSSSLRKPISSRTMARACA